MLIFPKTKTRAAKYVVTDQDRRLVIQLHNAGDTQQSIAVTAGISLHHVAAILKEAGKIWSRPNATAQRRTQIRRATE